VISATALVQPRQVLEQSQVVSVAALVAHVEDLAALLDSEVVAASVVFPVLPPATNVADQTTMLAIARLKQ